MTTVFQILFQPAIEILDCALHRLLVNYFADLMIDKAESTHLVYNNGQMLPVCNPLVLSIALGVISVEGCRQVRRRATNIALGQYWFLLLLHGFIPPGPGQYGVLLPWLEEDMT